MKRKFINFWKGIWEVVKSMSNWKGITSLFLVWFLLSGVGISTLGIIIANKYLIGLGGVIFGFWIAPGTPLMLITIAVALVVQRFVFQDKSVSWKIIKQKFKEIGESK